MEGFLTKLMYEVPGDHTIEKVIVTESTVENNEATIVKNNKRKPVNITVNNNSGVESSVS